MPPLHQQIYANVMGLVSACENIPMHRFQSWETCYLHFKGIKGNPRSDDEMIKLAALNLGFYLASWGMYRGSSFLLQRSFEVHSLAVRELLKTDYVVLWDAEVETLKSQENLAILLSLRSCLYEAYVKQARQVSRAKVVTDTLISKILLGTMACTPAFDRFFGDGCKMLRVRPHTNFSARSMRRLFTFYEENVAGFEAVSSEIESKRGFKYPPMKLVDMFFWRVGEIEYNRKARRRA